MSSPLFHFFTLVTKDDQYGAMRDSLARVGFDESNSVFTVLDNRGGKNAHEPYSAITRAVREAQAPYVVFCHQDLVFYHGPDALLKEIERVAAVDPDWSVIGNSGVRPDLSGSICIDDINGSHDSGDFPCLVVSLDEDLLIIRRDSGVGCSPELSGFHLYGTDICFNAYLEGGSAWVMEYRLEHLGTTLDFAAVHEIAPSFYRKWRRHIRGAVIFTPPMMLVFTRIPFLFAILNHRRLNRYCQTRFQRARTVDYLLRYSRPKWLPLARFAEGDPRAPRLPKGMGWVDAFVRRGRPRWPEGRRYFDVGPEDLERHYRLIRELEARRRQEKATESL